MHNSSLSETIIYGIQTSFGGLMVAENIKRTSDARLDIVPSLHRLND